MTDKPAPKRRGRAKPETPAEPPPEPPAELTPADPSPTAAMTEPEPEPPPTPQQQAARVRTADGHKLVTYGTWEISIGPDGLIRLPQLLHPNECDDFVGCLAVAKDVATHTIVVNEKAAENDDRSLPRRRAVVTQGPPPPGTTRMRVTPRSGGVVQGRASVQQRSASIGRPKRGQTAGQPQPQAGNIR